MSGVAALLRRLLRAEGPARRCLFLGLDASGRTTALYRLRLPAAEAVATIPTIGFNVETVTVAGRTWVGAARRAAPPRAPH